MRTFLDARPGRDEHLPAPRTVLATTDGRRMPLGVAQWLDAPDDVDHRVLARVEGPVLDVGCGPGRHVIALNHRGVVALGIDPSPAAVALALERGATVLRRSVFDHVPGTGRWRTALLLDGNVGIGGSPRLLLRRVASLLADGGAVVAEVEGTGGVEQLTVRVEGPDGASDWFDWATVGVAGAVVAAADAGLRLEHEMVTGGRRFLWLAA